MKLKDCHLCAINSNRITNIAFELDTPIFIFLVRTISINKQSHQYVNRVKMALHMGIVAEKAPRFSADQ